MKEGIYEQPLQKFPEANEEQIPASKLEAQQERTLAPEELEEFRGKEKTSVVTKTLFLTGATGFLGSHTAIELLRGGHKLIILARGAHEKTAPQRVEEAFKKILTQAEYDKFADSIKVVNGDIKEKNLGLTKEQLQEITNRNIEILHLAANLNFGMEKRKEVMSTNVGGTKNVLDFANKVGAKKFNFVSTAYVCGKKTGMVAEALVPESERPEFNNPYEESKYIAEQEVEMWRKKTNIPATIFRPSIIIKRGQTNNRSGYYAFASAFALLRQKIMIEDGRVKYPCNPNATLDLISVEDVAKCATRILEKENTTRGMEIFHMTNPKSRTIGEIFADSLALMGLDRKVELVNDLNLTNPDFYKALASQEVTKELVKILRDLTPYLFLNVKFDTENIARKIGSYNPESIDMAFLIETLKYRYIPGAPDDLINRIEAKRKTRFIPPEYIDREIHTAPTEQKAINLTLKIFQKAINIILRPSGVEDVRRLYSREAKSYDFKHRLTTAYNDNALRKEVAEEIRNILGTTSGVKSARILDLASGTGLTLETINNTLLKTDSAPTQLYGLDITEKMIEIGKKRLGNKTKIKLENGDATDFIGSDEGSNEGAYKFKPNSIDFITIVFGIGGIENSVKCFGEQLKALREGGIAIMVDMHAPSLKLDDIHMPFGLSPSPGLVRQAWEKVTKPLVLQKLWKWKDPTEDFYKMPLVTYFDAERNQYFGFEVVKREVKTMKWWLNLPVMPVAKLIVKKVPISKQEFLIKQNIIH